MDLAPPDGPVTTGRHAAAVPDDQRAPQRRRDGSRRAAHVDRYRAAACDHPRDAGVAQHAFDRRDRQPADVLRVRAPRRCSDAVLQRLDSSTTETCGRCRRPGPAAWSRAPTRHNSTSASARRCGRVRTSPAPRALCIADSSAEITISPPSASSSRRSRPCRRASVTRAAGAARVVRTHRRRHHRRRLRP